MGYIELYQFRKYYMEKFNFKKDGNKRNSKKSNINVDRLKLTKDCYKSYIVFHDKYTFEQKFKKLYQKYIIDTEKKNFMIE